MKEKVNLKEVILVFACGVCKSRIEVATEFVMLETFTCHVCEEFTMEIVGAYREREQF